MAGRRFARGHQGRRRKPACVGICRSCNTLRRVQVVLIEGTQDLTGVIHDEISLGVTLNQIHLKQVVHHALVVRFAVGFEERRGTAIEVVATAVGQAEAVTEFMHQRARLLADWGQLRWRRHPLAQGNGRIVATDVGIARSRVRLACVHRELWLRKRVGIGPIAHDVAGRR